MPEPTADGRTGRVPAGCVFWMHATERGFATVAGRPRQLQRRQLHARVHPARGGRDQRRRRRDRRGGLGRRGRLPRHPRRRGDARRDHLRAARRRRRHCDVVLVRLHAAGLMTLLDAWPELRIEGKPQCHIVAIAQGAGRGRGQRRVRAVAAPAPACPLTEATAAIPVARARRGRRAARPRRGGRTRPWRATPAPTRRASTRASMTHARPRSPIATSAGCATCTARRRRPTAGTATASRTSTGTTRATRRCSASTAST